MIIDQSGRVEETNKTTIVALADKNEAFTVALHPGDKKLLQTIFRKNGKPKVFPIVVFADLVFIAMLKSKNFPRELIIDMEYPGHENTIKNIIRTLCARYRKEFPEIYFANIGKKDPAHISAWETYKKRKTPNVVVTWENFKTIIPRKKK